MKSLLITKTGLWTITFHIFLYLSLLIPTSALSEKSMTWEGTIQGLNCTHYHKECPKDDLDMYIALEHDFVLVAPDGRHFLLPNLSVLIKARYLTQQVRITGEPKGSDSIWVENLEVKRDQAYKQVWNYAEQQRKLTEH